MKLNDFLTYFHIDWNNFHHITDAFISEWFHTDFSPGEALERNTCSSRAPTETLRDPSFGSISENLSSLAVRGSEFLLIFSVGAFHRRPERTHTHETLYFPPFGGYSPVSVCVLLHYTYVKSSILPFHVEHNKFSDESNSVVIPLARVHFENFPILVSCTATQFLRTIHSFFMTLRCLPRCR